MNTTTTQPQPSTGETLAEGMQIKSVETVLHSKALEKLNADAVAHGQACDKLDTDSQALVDAAETLEFGDFKKRVNAIVSSRLRLLQERLKFWSRREGLLQSIELELIDHVAKCKAHIETETQSLVDKLRAAGAGPEDSIAWEQGRTRQANREFNERVRESAVVVKAEKAWRVTKEKRDRIFAKNEWISKKAIEEELKKFIASRLA